jgi:hypothetical protein
MLLSTPSISVWVSGERQALLFDTENGTGCNGQSGPLVSLLVDAAHVVQLLSLGVKSQPSLNVDLFHIFLGRQQPLFHGQRRRLILFVI